MTSITFLETYLYPTVSIMATAYMISQAASVLIHKRLFGLRNRMSTRKKRAVSRKIHDVPAELLKSVEATQAGTSHTAKMIGAMIDEVMVPRSEAVRPEAVSVQSGFAGEIERTGVQSYRNRFLVNDGVCSRVSSYVNRDIHTRIKKLLSNAAPDISIVSYINNILNDHLDKHREDIEELYRQGVNKSFLPQNSINQLN